MTISETQAAGWQAVIDAIRARLGDGYLLGKGGVSFEATPKGRHVVKAGELRFWLDAGELIACRVRGGRAEFAEVTPAGEWLWTMAPLAQAGMN